MEQVVMEKRVVEKRRWLCSCSAVLLCPQDAKGIITCECCGTSLYVSPALFKPRDVTLAPLREIECLVCGENETFSILKHFKGAFKTPCCHEVLYADPKSDSLFFPKEWEAQGGVLHEPMEDVIVALIL